MISRSAALEAILFAAGGPLAKKRLSALLSLSDTDLAGALAELSGALAGRGVSLVVSDEARIEVRLRASRDVEVYAALDGQETFAFGEGDYVEITGSPRRLELVKAAGRDYYQVLRSKLKWGDAGGTSRRG